jgi:hypothetical protein
MSDPLKELLAAGAVPATSFPPTSRYASTDVVSHDAGDGTPPTPHLARRFCPAPERFADLHEAVVGDTDRRDTLSAVHLGDPELWWRLADANGVVDPRELTERLGRRIRVTAEVDVPGSPDA